MRNVNVLWAAAMGAIGGAILYVTGRQDGQEEGVVVGYMNGFNAGISTPPVEQGESKDD